MSRIVATARRPAYTLAVVLLMCFLVLAFVAIMSGLVVVDWGRDRRAALDACAAETIASARAWGDVHAAELASGQSVVLPLGDLLPTGMTGAAEVRCIQSATGDLLLKCEVSVERAGRRLTREAVWPARARGAGPVGNVRAWPLHRAHAIAGLG